MNHAKIAAALHALADAFLADVEAVEGAITGKKGGKKAPEQPAAPPASAPAALTTAAAAPAPASAPATPTVALKDVNALVLKVAAKNRDGAVAILNRFKLATTVGLAPELWQPVYDAFEEEIAKMDAAAVQVQQASLV
jgi:hypothetical protein